MEKKIDGLRWSPMWTSHLGCLKGCLDYLGLNVSTGWLFGGTGHAFALNIHEVVCPSGPTAWKTKVLLRLGRNIGCNVEGTVGFKSDDDFSEKQEAVWERTKLAIDEGLPCYGWELEIPEFYIVYGYDDRGYYFSGPGCDTGKGPKPWQEVGTSQIGVLEMFTVTRGEAAEVAKTVRDAFQFALEYSKNSEKWTLPKYRSGLPGYDTWIGALERGVADGFGMAYNAAVWSECRKFAVEFLKEAQERLSGELRGRFDQAILHYAEVARNLDRLTEMFPFPPRGDGLKDAKQRDAAMGCLGEARRAEEAGLEVLAEIVGAL